MTSAAISASGYPMMGRGIYIQCLRRMTTFTKAFRTQACNIILMYVGGGMVIRSIKQKYCENLMSWKQGGIGGVEINPIRWPQNADTMGIKELTWGSDEWLDVVEAAVKGAKEKVVCDMIVGSGWPYGGEFVPKHEQCQMIALGN